MRRDAMNVKDPRMERSTWGYSVVYKGNEVGLYRTRMEARARIHAILKKRSPIRNRRTVALRGRTR